MLTVRDRKTFDTRNYAETGAPKLPVGQDLAVRWVDIANPDTERDDLRARGAATSARPLFARGEGMWYGNDAVYFACTNGGLGMRGQIFKYTPSPAEGTAGEDASPGKLQLYLEPNNSSPARVVRQRDRRPVGRSVHLRRQRRARQRRRALRGLQLPPRRDAEGKIYTIGRNRYPGGSELAGICFAPNHPTMFVNIQHAGLTLAITGPWQSARRTSAASFLGDRMSKIVPHEFHQRDFGRIRRPTRPATRRPCCDRRRTRSSRSTSRSPRSPDPCSARTNSGRTTTI